MTSTTMGTAVITCASAGIGAIYAERLAKRGYDLILVVRNGQRLDNLAARLKAVTGRSVDTVVAGLANQEDLSGVEKLVRDDPRITMLVNDAGVGSVASFLKAGIDEMGNMINLNITALTRLTYAIIPVFVAKKFGTVINISSVVGIAAELLNGVYSASKAYMSAFGDKLQNELADTGVRVQTVLPAATATEFWDVAGYAAQKENSSTMSGSDLVDAALAGLDQGELVTMPTLQDRADWDNWEAERRALTPKFANATPAPR